MAVSMVLLFTHHAVIEIARGQWRTCDQLFDRLIQERVELSPVDA
jgi:hypothetical protein